MVGAPAGTVRSRSQIAVVAGPLIWRTGTAAAGPGSPSWNAVTAAVTSPSSARRAGSAGRSSACTSASSASASSVQPDARTAPSSSTRAVNGPSGVGTVARAGTGTSEGRVEQLSPWLDAAGARPDPSLADWILVSLTLGIVGLPNVGKSTMFNALTRNDVLAANYPFATIEPNVGVVPLRDPRLDRLAEMFSSEKVVPATVSFVDIAGIVAGASEGAGLGNKFLANIREADAICQVVRVFADDDVVHVDGRVDPAADIETDRDRARPRRPADAGEGPPAPREGGAGQEGDQGGRRRGRRTRRPC